ncbi:hypothetical protein SAMN05216388_102124 [Halorientalis persicus]|jgi:hypothetical protein|uniref:AMP-binding enzyme n=1 Tax=Halorientalis persicus TaxID=1367881 RepID=A0A1H8T4E5_9EURY|nr:hypothetical protein [Halorientalis persicus]SEO85732.1 hypothetical protein SAMN05216388_102124 [Halorientalis persicus]
MDVIGDLVARERRVKEPLVYGDGSQPYTAHKFCTDAWKTASLFRYHGVGPERAVAVAVDPAPQSLLSVFGAALLGAPVRFGLPPEGDPRVVVGPATEIEGLSVEPGTKRVIYGDEPSEPDVIHFERDIWSENPTMPPDTVATDQSALITANRTYTHEDLLTAAERVVDQRALTEDDAVAVRASLARPGTLVAGVFAPLQVGASVLLAENGPEPTLVVGGEGPSGLDPDDVLD